MLLSWLINCLMQVHQHHTHTFHVLEKQRKEKKVKKRKEPNIFFKEKQKRKERKIV